MILFREDWDRFPEAIVNNKTDNETFKRMAALYRSMGVKNNVFMLSLLNKDLVGIDPFSPNLTEDEMLAIATECYFNFWFFMREILMAPGNSGGDAIRIRANRGNLAVYWLFFNHIMTFLIQIRQTGKSFSVDALMVYLLNVGAKGTQINLLTKDDNLRTKNLDRIKNIESNLPIYLKQRKKSDISNTEEIYVSALGNSYTGHLPNKSEKAALNIGRGLTSPVFHIDEAAFLYNIGISLGAALSGGGAARDIARENNAPHGTILTTTAGKLDDRDGKFIYGLLQQSATWSEKFFDAKNLKDLEKIISHSSEGGVIRVNCTFSHRQLGFTDEWLRKTIQDSTAVGDDADRDFFNKWTSGSLTSPLTIAILNKIKESEKEPTFTKLYDEGYVMRWYIPEEDVDRRLNTESFIMGVDTSDAGGSDDITIIIASVATGKTIGAASINETNLINFSQWLCSLLVRYKKVTAIIERRSSGPTIIDYLLLMLPTYDEDPFRRLFNRVVNDKDEFKDRFKEVATPALSHKDKDIFVKYKKYFGFSTSGSGLTSRSDLYGITLQNCAKQVGDRAYDSKLINQIMGLIVKNGRVDHDTGQHDDMVISWLLSFWLMTMGKNLEFYGINTREILIDTKTEKKVNSAAEYYDQVMQNQNKIEIENLLTQLSTEQDENMSLVYERKLVYLNSRLTSEEKTHLAIDDVINKIRDTKRLNRINNKYNHNQNNQYYGGNQYISNSSMFGFRSR